MSNKNKFVKKTPWFSGEEKPVRFGVYEISNIFGGHGVDEQITIYAVYSPITKNWYFPNEDFCAAYAEWEAGCESFFQNLSWRGVLK